MADADLGIGSLFMGIRGTGGGSGGPAFSLHGHTGRMMSMNCAASDAEPKLTWKRRYDWVGDMRLSAVGNRRGTRKSTKVKTDTGCAYVRRGGRYVKGMLVSDSYVGASMDGFERQSLRRVDRVIETGERQQIQVFLTNTHRP
jgi:hypothetical protein